VVPSGKRGRHFYDGHDESLRDAVCIAYDEILDDPLAADVSAIAARHGLHVDHRFAMAHARTEHEAELQRLEGRLRAGESLRLMCWCAPKRCHAAGIARCLNRRLGRPEERVRCEAPRGEESMWERGERAHRELCESLAREHAHLVENVDPSGVHMGHTEGAYGEAVRGYWEWLLGEPDVIRRVRAQLRGRRVACHALAAIANCSECELALLTGMYR
jgi:hypothetical protein